MEETNEEYLRNRGFLEDLSLIGDVYASHRGFWVWRGYISILVLFSVFICVGYFFFILSYTNNFDMFYTGPSTAEGSLAWYEDR